MPTLFTSTSGNSVDCSRFSDFLENLTIIASSNSDVMVDIKDLMEPKTSIPVAVTLLENSIEAYSGKDSIVSIFESLKSLAVSCADDEEWRDVLGEITEATFVKLIEMKYGAPPQQEVTASVSDCSGVLISSLEGKSMDAVQWNNNEDHGEMHEIKKCIRSSISSRKVKSKLRIMAKFKREVEIFSSKKSFIGVCSLLEAQQIAEIIVNKAAGRPNPRLNCLGRDGIPEWLTNKYFSHAS